MFSLFDKKFGGVGKVGELETLRKKLDIIKKQKEVILFEEARLIRLIKQQEKHEKKENS